MYDEFPKQDITIYHKNSNKENERFDVKASVRLTYTINHNRTGSSSVDSALIRVFENDITNKEMVIAKDDVIVVKKVTDTITNNNTPYTELSEKYGKDNVFKVHSVENLVFNDSDIQESNHIKIGCI